MKKDLLIIYYSIVKYEGVHSNLAMAVIFTKSLLVDMYRFSCYRTLGQILIFQSFHQ